MDVNISSSNSRNEEHFPIVLITAKLKSLTRQTQTTRDWICIAWVSSCEASETVEVDFAKIVLKWLSKLYLPPLNFRRKMAGGDVEL